MKKNWKFKWSWKLFVSLVVVVFLLFALFSKASAKVDIPSEADVEITNIGFPSGDQYYFYLLAVFTEHPGIGLDPHSLLGDVYVRTLNGIEITLPGRWEETDTCPTSVYCLVYRDFALGNAVEVFLKISKTIVWLQGEPVWSPGGRGMHRLLPVAFAPIIRR